MSQAAWGDYCRAAAVLKCWKKCWWRTAEVADHKRQTHKARDTDLSETVVKQYVLCGLETVEPQDKNYTIFVHDKLPLVLGKLSRQPVLQQAFLMSNFVSLLAAAFCQMNVPSGVGGLLPSGWRL